MMDAEKILTALKICGGAGSCGGCYRDEEFQSRYGDSSFNICTCKNKLMLDAATLIEKQQEKMKEWEKHGSFLFAHGMFDLVDDGK